VPEWQNPAGEEIIPAYYRSLKRTAMNADWHLFIVVIFESNNAGKQVKYSYLQFYFMRCE